MWAVSAQVATALVLAAGRGERLRPLTDSLPKPLLEIGSKALIEYHLEALQAAGVRRTIVNLSWLPRPIIERLGDGSRFGMQLIFSYEGPEPLETAGGISRALPWLGREPFWVVNGDVFTDFDFSPLALGVDDLAHLLLVPNPSHNPRGDFALCDGLVDFQRTALDDRTNLLYTYCGVGLFRPEMFTGVGPGRVPLGPLLRQLAGEGRVLGTVHDGVWDDIGTEARLQRRRDLC